MARLIGINLLVLLCLVVLLELGFRTAYFGRTCLKESCDTSVFTWVNFLGRVQVGFSTSDPVLGYRPNPGRFHINFKGWNDKTVTILDDTTRSNGNEGIADAGVRILAVGDSFTFGDQVSDNETWPSALERRLGVRVVNGGVFGYGFGQAMLRAKALLEKKKADIVILSPLVPEDFRRDQYIVRMARTRPTWVRTEGGIAVRSPAESRELADELIAEARKTHLPHATGYSYVLSKVNRDFFGYNGGYYIKHPQAAELTGIVCAVVEDFAKLDAKKVIHIQHGLHGLYQEEPPIVDHLKDCAARQRIPVISSYDWLKSADDPEELFFGHMTPKGNEFLAEFIAMELRKLFPGLPDAVE